MNGELVDELVDCKQIRSRDVERVFRLVNRCNYIPTRYTGYFKSAWRRGRLHLSAGCIYAVAMEELELKPGLSFLNIGSGTGYFSTMVGLILGPFGINHGVEIYDDVVWYADKKLEEFRISRVADVSGFAEPIFLQGNGLCLPADLPGYDRIYVGVGCTREYRDYLKRLLNVGGILIAPIENMLVKIRRKSATQWKRDEFLLYVSFASIVTPTDDSKILDTKLFCRKPRRLDELCRISIKNILRSNVDKDVKGFFDYYEQKKDILNEPRSGSDMSDKSEEEDESEQINNKIRKGFSSLKRTFEEVNLEEFSDSLMGLIRIRRRISNDSENEEPPVDDPPPSVPSSLVQDKSTLPSSSSSSSSSSSLPSSPSSTPSEALYNFDRNSVRSESSLSLSSQSGMPDNVQTILYDIDCISKHSKIIDMYLTDYTSKLMEKIDELPLPVPLKRFINNNKDIVVQSQE